MIEQRPKLKWKETLFVSIVNKGMESFNLILEVSTYSLFATPCLRILYMYPKLYFIMSSGNVEGVERRPWKIEEMRERINWLHSDYIYKKIILRSTNSSYRERSSIKMVIQFQHVRKGILGVKFFYSIWF